MTDLPIGPPFDEYPVHVTVDFAWDDTQDFISALASFCGRFCPHREVDAVVLDPKGPGGGWPVIMFLLKDQSELFSFLLTYGIPESEWADYGWEGE